MSFERRIRDELQRGADRITLDVERNLGAVEGSARRRTNLGAPTLMAATAVIAVAILMRVGATPPSIGGPSPNPASSAISSAPITAGPAYQAIAGTYTSSIDASGPSASAEHLGGSWTMRLLPDGEMLLSAPATYGSIPPSGVAFSLVGDRFRTNLFYNDFCSSVGVYTWSLQGDALSFAPVDESCGIRQTLLSSSAWQMRR